MARLLFESAMMFAGWLLYVGFGYVMYQSQRTRRFAILIWLWVVVWTVAVVLVVLAIWGILIVPGTKTPTPLPWWPED